MQEIGNCVQQNQSEVACLMQQLEAEGKALWAGMYGLSQCAQHKIIHARYRRLGEIVDALEPIVGEEQAMDMLAKALDS